MGSWLTSAKSPKEEDEWLDRMDCDNGMVKGISYQDLFHANIL